jgi:hypothetical protein
VNSGSRRGLRCFRTSALALAAFGPWSGVTLAATLFSLSTRHSSQVDFAAILAGVLLCALGLVVDSCARVTNANGTLWAFPTAISAGAVLAARWVLAPVTAERDAAWLVCAIALVADGVLAVGSAAVCSRVAPAPSRAAMAVGVVWTVVVTAPVTWYGWARAGFWPGWSSAFAVVLVALRGISWGRGSSSIIDAAAGAAMLGLGLVLDASAATCHLWLRPRHESVAELRTLVESRAVDLVTMTGLGTLCVALSVAAAAVVELYLRRSSGSAWRRE